MRQATNWRERQQAHQAERDALNATRREQYATDKEKRQAQLRARRKERVEWLKHYLSSQPCAQCGLHTRDITWHNADASLDHENEQRNLSHVRTLAQQGYSLAKLEAEVQRLLPLCKTCLPRVRPTFSEYVTLTNRQAYARLYYAKNCKKTGDYMKARREQRRAWLAEQMNRPCVRCGATEDIEWHRKDIAQDFINPDDNFYLMRTMINNGAKYERMERELDSLFPTCPACYAHWRQANE